MDDLKKLADLIEQGNANAVCAWTQQLLDSGVSVEKIVQEGIVSGLEEVGRKYETQEYYITEMLRAARAAKLCSEIICSCVEEQRTTGRKKIVLGTVAGDLHDIGKNLVALTVSCTGVAVVDLGVDVSPERFLQAVEEDPDVAFVGVSALLTTTKPAMQEAVAALNQSVRRSTFKVMVGGVPITQAFADEIGADYYTSNAFEAAKVISSTLGIKGGWKL